MKTILLLVLLHFEDGSRSGAEFTLHVGSLGEAAYFCRDGERPPNGAWPVGSDRIGTSAAFVVDVMVAAKANGADFLCMEVT